ncbi:SDR family oxidoreductase [Streptacidiphilus sp. PAMC 29251]
MTTSPILVTGGTGTLGRHVLPLLRAAGQDVRVLSRHSHQPAAGVEYVSCDLLTGDAKELDAALAGVSTVLHLACGPKGDDRATARLVEAAARAGVTHLVYISVIGADTVPVAWVAAKHAAEQAVVNSGIPYTVLRAAQFHDLTLTMVEKMAKLPVVPNPGGLRMQPVDAREVATRLVELTLADPTGFVAELAGPTVYAMDQLTRGYLKAAGKHRPLLPVRIPGKAGRSYRAGQNLNLADADLGTRTWEDFLAERVS